MKKQAATDALFAFRIVGTLTHSIPQLHHMLRHTEGVSLSMFMCLTIFFGSLLRLSWQTNKLVPSRLSKQVMIGYVIGCTLSITGVLIIGWHWLHGRYLWGASDNRTLLFAGASSLIVTLIGRWHNLPLTDPIVQGWLANAIKSVPQTFLAYKMWQEGGGGYTAIAIWLSHVMIMIRVIQVVADYVSAPERRKAGLIIAEVGNELSWCIVTIAWLYGGPR